MAVVQQPGQDSRGNDGVSQELAPLAESLLEVRMMLPRPYLADTRVKKAVADSRS